MSLKLGFITKPVFRGSILRHVSIYLYNSVVDNQYHNRSLSFSDSPPENGIALEIIELNSWCSCHVILLRKSHDILFPVAFYYNVSVYVPTSSSCNCSPYNEEDYEQGIRDRSVASSVVQSHLNDFSDDE
jgi:hypothetical protein